MSDQQGWTAPGASTPPSGDGDALRDLPTAASDSDPTADPGWGPPPPAAWQASGPTVDAPAGTPPPPPPPPPGQGHPTPLGSGYPPPANPQVPPAAPGQPDGGWPAGWAPPQLAPKPGIIPLRPLTLGEIWGGVMTAIRANPAATIGLALVTTAVVLVPLTLIGLWVASSDSGPSLLDPGFDPASGAPADPSSFATGFLGGGVVASILPGLAMYVTALLLPVFMAVVIGQGVQGRRIGFGETARAARGRILPALGVVLLVGLAALIFIGLLVGSIVAAWTASGNGDGGGAALVTFVVVVVGVVGFVFFSVRWGFAITTVVLEGARPVQALRRSWQLTRKRGFWRIFGIRLLTGIVAGIAGSVITAPVGFGVGMVAGSSTTSTAWMFVLVQAGSVLVQSVLTTPFSSGVDSLLYVDQRIRYEGLDMALLQQAQQGHDAPVM